MPAARTAKLNVPAASRPDAFRGWPPEAVDFFDELEIENTKAYWTAHKGFYEQQVLGPMMSLLAELASEFGEGRVFRPYRDTRFSADKSPYKTNIAAHNAAGYVSLSAGALGVGTGLYMPSAAQLARFRAAVADDSSGPALEQLVAALGKKKISVNAHETLRSAPRGYPPDHPRIELLRQKGLTAWREWPVGRWLSTSEPKRRIVEVLRSTEPLRRWLDHHVGMADEP